MIDLRHAYLCARDLDERGCPVLPEAWTCTEQDAGWYTLTRQRDGLTIAAWKANTRGIAATERRLFALFGPIEFLASIAAADPSCMPAREAWARRGEANVRAALRNWRTWRIDGHVRDAEGVAQPVTGAVVQLVPDGARIPDPSTTPLPWLLRADGSVTAVQAEAAVRVAVIHRPAMVHTLAGYSLHAVCEDEPERS